MKISDNSIQKNNDEQIFEMILQFQQQHRNVFFVKLDDQFFIYKSLGRKDYRLILSDEKYDDCEKEELICQSCLLYPNDYDLDECEAGIPTTLARRILADSFLDTDLARANILNFYRKEMYDVDNQITCLINEAFPQHDVEDIENWDIEQTTKYLSMAEWKLHHLRGLPFVDPAIIQADSTQPPEHRAYTEELHMTPSNNAEMTNEKYMEMKRKYPGIDWDKDFGSQGVEGLRQPKFNTESPALWTPDEFEG